MNTPVITRRAVHFALLAVLLATRVPAQSFDSSAFSGMRWREIGPYRGGRSVAVAGSGSRVTEYWMGTTGGGVFKTTDGGLSWVRRPAASDCVDLPAAPGRAALIAELITQTASAQAR